MAALAGVGFAAGLPFILITEALSAWLSRIGVDVATIGLVALIGVPYGLKFIWAPLLDRYAPPGLGKFGRRRGWLIVSQIAIAFLLAFIAVIGPKTATDAIWPIAIVGTALVLMAATQDIVADAYRADVLTPFEFGAGAAVFVSGYRIAMVMGGAFALIMADSIGWPAVFAIMAALMGLSLIVTLIAPMPPHDSSNRISLREAVVQPVQRLIAGRGWKIALALIVFILLFRMPDHLAGRMTMPLLVQELGYSDKQIGWIRQLLGFAITIIGALIGGSIVARIGFMRSLVIFGIAQALSNAGLLALANRGDNDLFSLAVVIAVESFCGGLVAAGFVAFLMSCCDWRYSATQYAIFTGLMALSQYIVGAAAGFLVELLGYPSFFAVTIATGVPGLMLLPWLSGATMTSQREENDLDSDSTIAIENVPARPV